MRRIFLHINVSLDGYICDAGGEIDWSFTSTEFQQYLDELLGSIGGMVFGRVAYEELASYWPNAGDEVSEVQRRQMHELPKYALSRTVRRKALDKRAQRRKTDRLLGRARSEGGGGRFGLALDLLDAAWSAADLLRAMRTGGIGAGYVVVGEQGPEVVKLPHGSHVKPNANYRSALSRGSMEMTEDQILDLLRKEVRYRGGDAQKVLGGVR